MLLCLETLVTSACGAQAALTLDIQHALQSIHVVKHATWIILTSRELTFDPGTFISIDFGPGTKVPLVPDKK